MPSLIETGSLETNAQKDCKAFFSRKDRKTP